MNSFRFAFLVLLLPMIGAQCANIIVSPTGRPYGDGGVQNPLDLSTALSMASPAQPGDTILLRGGVYWGKFNSELYGTAQQPITVRSYPDEWAKIDSGFSWDRNPILHVGGRWTTFRDFEITSLDPNRITAYWGSYPGDIRRGEGVSVRAPGTKLVNLVIHDTAGAIGAWSEAPDTEIYGCLIYYNGWQGPDRAHGHGIYSQNLNGTRLIRDNIIFSQFEKGIQVYGSSAAYLRNHWIEGNIAFNNGILSREQDLTENLTLYGGHGPEGNVIKDNLFYGSQFRGKLMIGGSGAKDLVFQNNYVPHLTRIRFWQTAQVTGNTFVRDSTLLEFYLDSQSSTYDYVWDRNTYYNQEKRYFPFGLYQISNYGYTYGRGAGFDEWQQWTSFDESSVYIKGRPTGLKVVVRPNAYDSRRAHVAVYNWDHLPAIQLDLGSVLSSGQAFEIYNAQNYLGLPVISGTFGGGPITLPMIGLNAAQPVGHLTPMNTSPEFNAFVLRAKDPPAPEVPANEPPTISSIPAQVTNFNTPTVPIPFTIGDSETGAGHLGVLASSSNPDLVPNENLRLAGTDAERTIQVIPALNQQGTATISIAVNDGQLVTTQTFSLTVRPYSYPPAISRIIDLAVAGSATTTSILFMVGDPDTPASQLSVSARSSNPVHVPVENIVATGADTLRVLTITPAPNQYGATRIDLTVTDGLASTETSFTFTSMH